MANNYKTMGHRKYAMPYLSADTFKNGLPSNIMNALTICRGCANGKPPFLVSFTFDPIIYARPIF